MSKSQETYNKKQREKERAKKKQEKRDNREAKKNNSQKGIDIDWSLAPENKTLSKKELENKEQNRINNTNK